MKILFVITTALTFLLASSDIQAQNAYVLAADNPFSVVSLSHFAAPALGDIDADGDLDLFVGQYNSNVMLFYRNTGTEQVPEYEQQTGDDNPLDLYHSNSGCNSPVLVDIDADSDLDVFVGNWAYIIRYLSNEGDTMSPDFVFHYDDSNPLLQVMTEGICAFPAFFDVDNDMDLDVFVSDGDGNIEYYENTGSNTNPVFELDTVNNVLGGLALTARTKIAFEDINGDGLKDAVISQDTDEPELLYFANTGTLGNPVFEEKTGAENPFDGITGTEALVPVFADIDDDGDRDLILGTWLSVRLYKAVKTSGTSGTSLDNKFSIYPNPASREFTIQGDGIRDIEVIDQQGSLIRHLNASGNKTNVQIGEESTGIFFVRLITDSGTAINKVMLQ